MTDEKCGWLKKGIEGVWKRKNERKGWKNEMKTIKKCNRNREEISKYKRVKNSKTKGKKC